MTEFTADMYCSRCKKITPHRVFFIFLHGEAKEDMYVQIGRFCMRMRSYPGARKRSKKMCSKHREDMLHVRDYNALTRIAKEDYPSDFTT